MGWKIELKNIDDLMRKRSDERACIVVNLIYGEVERA
jgi:hypothetical protein